jgi:hypothetical protein
MSDIALMKAKRIQDRERIKHNTQLKKLKIENRREYEKTRDINSTDIRRMQDRYDAEKTNLKTVLEEKLSKLRLIQNTTFNDEKKRLDIEIVNLKRIHDDKVLEIKQNQSTEIDKMKDSHKGTINNARKQYIKEKMKWQVI